MSDDARPIGRIVLAYSSHDMASLLLFSMLLELPSPPLPLAGVIGSVSVALPMPIPLKSIADTSPLKSIPSEQSVNGYSKRNPERICLLSITRPDDTHIHESVYVTASRFSAYVPALLVTSSIDRIRSKFILVAPNRRRRSSDTLAAIRFRSGSDDDDVHPADE